ncbi:DUF2783 domain-containing protein [Collimonas antrihumi]|uniref:DUF2783 domain-containing protein n=1 Tax=Collimonas antrihumi TaxID=1940615 RepID=UPI001B8CEF35
MHLNIQPNLGRPDDFYEMLIDTHRDLSNAQSQMLNAELILLLANHIGDINVLREAMALARTDIELPMPIANQDQKMETLAA